MFSDASAAIGKTQKWHIISTRLKARLYETIILPMIIYGADVGRYDHRRHSFLRYLRCAARGLLEVLQDRLITIDKNLRICLP